MNDLRRIVAILAFGTAVSGTFGSSRTVLRSHREPIGAGPAHAA